VQRDVLTSPHPHAQLQAVESVQSSDPFPIHPPAFPTQQHPDPQIPKPGPGVSQIANAHPQRGLILRAASSRPGGPTELGEATGPQATDLKRILKPGGQFSTACGP
jgi:hypothetical protein